MVSLKGDDLKINFNATTLSDDLITELKRKKSEIINYLKAQESYTRITPAAYAENYPLSSSQKRLWALSQLDEASTAYNMPFIQTIRGDYDVTVLEKAIEAVVERHEILRTVYRENDEGEVRQWILPKGDSNVKAEFVDFTNRDSESEITSYITEQTNIVFDLQKGPLLKICFIQTKKEEYILYFNLHHSICDAWSIEVMTKDILTFYTFFKENTKPDIEKLEIQFKDYAVWQNKMLTSTIADEDKVFWLDKLSGELPVLDLPGQKKRPKYKTFSGAVISSSLSQEISDGLKNLCIDKGGSLFMGLLAVWKVLLYRYTAQKDIIIGTPVAGRDMMQLENQIGFYVNTIALRNTIDENDSYVTFFDKLKDTTLASFSHYLYPFDTIIDDLGLILDKNRNPVFDVIFTCDKANTSIEKVDHSKNIQSASSQVSAKFDLGFHMTETHQGIDFNVNYNVDIYEAETIERLISHFKQLAKAILLNPNTKIKQYCYLSEDEKKDLLHVKNGIITKYPKESSVVTLFKEQVASTPNAKALIFGNTTYTYKELDELSNRLSQYIRKEFEFQKEDLIGVKLQKSEWMIVSLLSILKLGAAYVPIDPNYPEERIKYIEKDSNCKYVIDDTSIKNFLEHKDEYTSQFSTIETSPSDLAYVMYTSGSTGQPKGVMVEHRSIVRLVKSTNFYNFSRTCTLLSTGAFSFDATTIEYWGTLLNGSRLVLCSRQELLDADSLMHLMHTHGINVMWFTVV